MEQGSDKKNIYHHHSGLSEIVLHIISYTSFDRRSAISSYNNNMSAYVQYMGKIQLVVEFSPQGAKNDECSFFI